MPDSIDLVQQIASAAQYLHEFGVIHSNISSHCVLICKRHDVRLNAKLSSFELATAVHVEPIQQAINKRYNQTPAVLSESDESAPAAVDANVAELQPNASATGVYAFVKPRRKWLHDKYREKSKQPIPIDDTTDVATDHSYLTVPSEFLAYHTNYRRHLALFNYQAPELMVAPTADLDFVYPTVAADVYGLTLMLWELLNEAVPYVVYSAATLAAQFARGERDLLPQLQQQRSRYFGELFAAGLEFEPLRRRRRLSMQQLLQRMREASEQYDRLESVLDSSAEETLNEMVVEEDVADAGADQPQQPPEDERRQSQSPTSPVPIDTKPTTEQERSFTALAQSRSLHPSTWSALNKSTSSSLFDVQLHAHLCEGRTSTIKRRKTVSRTAQTNGQTLTAAATLPFDEAMATATDSALGSTADELDDARVYETIAKIDANDVQEEDDNDDVFQRSMCTRLQLTADKSRFLSELLVEDEDAGNHSNNADRASKSLGNIIEEHSTTPERKALNSSALVRSLPAQNNTSADSAYRFEIDTVALPKTPIARENTIRRYCWLTEKQLQIETKSDDDEQEAISTVNVEQRRKLFDRPATGPATNTSLTMAVRPSSGDSVVIEHRTTSPALGTPTRPRNVSIKIIHSRVTPSPTAAKRPGVVVPAAASGSPFHSSHHISWQFGAKRVTKSGEMSPRTEANADAGDNEHVEFVGRKPTRLSYSESQLRKEHPQIGAFLNTEADHPGELLPALPTSAPPPALPSTTLFSSRDLSAEFNTLATTATTASGTDIDNVTQDFQKIIRDMEALSRNNTLSRQTTASNGQTAKPIVAKRTTVATATKETVLSPAPPVPIETPTVEDIRERTPVKETIMQFENWLALNKTQSPFNNTAGDRSRSFVRLAQQRESPVPSADAGAAVSTSTPANTPAPAEPEPEGDNFKQPFPPAVPAALPRQHRFNAVRLTSESSGTDSVDTCSDDTATPMRSATVARLIAASPTSSGSGRPSIDASPVVRARKHHQQHHKTTVIKRTVVTESIVSSVANGDGGTVPSSPMPKPTLAPMSSSCSKASRRKQHTTQVRLNMTSRRQSVDGSGLLTQNLVQRWAVQRSQEHAVRHSICGSTTAGSDRDGGTTDAESCWLESVRRPRAPQATADEVIAGLLRKLCPCCSEVVEADEQLRSEWDHRGAITKLIHS